MYPCLIVTELLPPLYGGADIAAYRYYRFLREKGGNVWLMGTDNKMNDKDGNVFSVQSVQLNPTIKRLGGNYILLFFLFIQVFYFLLRHRELRLVHAFNSITPLVQATILAGHILGRKIILEVSLRGTDDPVSVMKNKGRLISRLASGKGLRKLIYRRAHAYVSKSPFLTTTFSEAGIDLKKVYEIPYFVDTQKYYRVSDQARTALRQKLGLPVDKQIVCFVGGITVRKGVDILVKAFQHCRQINKDIFLLLVGPTEKYNQDYVQSIRDSMMVIGTEFGCMTGQVSNTYEWMQASDVYVLASSREGFPISILEALCCGLPVIASDIPEIRNVQIRHGENGFLFTPGSVEGLQYYLEQVLFYTVSFSKSSIQDEAFRKYSITGIADQYRELYKKLL